MYSKNLLFILFSHWFLWAIFINNLFESYFSKKILLFIWVLFLFYYIFKKKYLFYSISILLGFILWIFISQNSVDIIKDNNTFLWEFQKKTYNYELLIKDISKKDEFQNSYQTTIIRINDSKTDENYFDIDKDPKVSWIQRDIVIKVPNMYKLEIWDIISSNTKIYLFQDTQDFAYKSYMNSKNIYASSSLNSINTIGNQKIFFLKEYAIQLRQKLLDIIYEIYPKNEAIFLGWILLWARESLSDEIKEDFNRSWLTHFIAVSWFNITILIIFVSFTLKYFPQIIQISWITIFIVFFVLLVWDTAPVIRAAIMWLLWYYILVSWRNTHSYTLISLTGAIMVFISPLSLNYDVSFHLSFLAVVWIIFTQNFYKKIFDKAPEFLAIKEALSSHFCSSYFYTPSYVIQFLTSVYIITNC